MAPRGLTRALLLATAALLLAACPASAGEYHVYSCRTPSGLVAPTDGWSAGEHPPYDPTVNTCDSGGGLVAALDAGYEHEPNSENDKATWAFNAPSGEEISQATIWRAGQILGGGSSEESYVVWLSGGAPFGLEARPFSECLASKGCVDMGSLVDPSSLENRVIAPTSSIASPHLYLNAYCGSPYKKPCPAYTGEGRYAAIIELFAADIVLSQSGGPTVSGVRGGLAEDASVQGKTDVAFHAADSGSGVYEAVIAVDGTVTGRTALNENGGRCRDVGGTTDGLPAFLYTQPCPAALDADVPFDTTTLTNGTHHLVVSVTDAAGNAATVLDREIAVANPAPPGSPAACAEDLAPGATAGGGAVTLAAGFAHHRGARWRSRFGTARTLVGRLTGPGGAGLAGVPLEVCELPAAAGAQPIPLGLPRTDSAGRFTLALPRTLPSCALRVAYRAIPGTHAPTAARTLTLTVPAALVLRISPRRARSQGTIRFRGRLLGGPIPAGGKSLILEARAPGGRWLEFHVLHTGPRGNFAYLYRFRLPGPALYQFRALSEAEADFPFAAGASRAVGVREG